MPSDPERVMGFTERALEKKCALNSVFRTPAQAEADWASRLPFNMWGMGRPQNQSLGAWRTSIIVGGVGKVCWRAPHLTYAMTLRRPAGRAGCSVLTINRASSLYFLYRYFVAVDWCPRQQALYGKSGESRGACSMPVAGSGTSGQQARWNVAVPLSNAGGDRCMMLGESQQPWLERSGGRWRFPTRTNSDSLAGCGRQGHLAQADPCRDLSDRIFRHR